MHHILITRKYFDSFFIPVKGLLRKRLKLAVRGGSLHEKPFRGFKYFQWLKILLVI